MSKMYLFESGSTKTTVLIAEINNSENNPIYKSLDLPGYNPNRPNIRFLEVLSAMNIDSNDSVHFYGSGLASKEYQLDLAERFKSLFNCEFSVNGDLIGAARATLNDSPGIVGILGTGGVVGHYDGAKIQKQNGGYGYLIDDIGGGYELGKRIVSAWLNGCFPMDLENAISTYFNSDKERFIRDYYSDMNASNNKEGLDLIGKVTTILPPFMEGEELKALLLDYFEVFFTRHILPMINSIGMKRVAFVGSIAQIFRGSIETIANRYGIEIATIIQYPAENLLKYHLKKT